MEDAVQGLKWMRFNGYAVALDGINELILANLTLPIRFHSAPRFARSRIIPYGRAGRRGEGCRGFKRPGWAVSAMLRPTLGVPSVHRTQSCSSAVMHSIHPVVGMSGHGRHG